MPRLQYPLKHEWQILGTCEALSTPKLVAEITNEPRLFFPCQLSLGNPMILLNTTSPAFTNSTWGWLSDWNPLSILILTLNCSEAQRHGLLHRRSAKGKCSWINCRFASACQRSSFPSLQISCTFFLPCPAPVYFHASSSQNALWPPRKDSLLAISAWYLLSVLKGPT